MFQTTGAAYDAFMGRYSRPLATEFLDSLPEPASGTCLDIGCGPGALTRVLVDRLGASSVAACDPSPPFVAETAAAFPEADVRLARAEALPFDDDRFDLAVAQLVLHFVSDPEAAAAEMRRVVRPAGVVAACMWDFADEMEMLRHFWDAALAIDPDAPDEARTLRFGSEGEIVELFEAAGFVDAVETTLRVSSEYADFDELWSGFLAGIGPAGSYCVSLNDRDRAALRDELFERVGAPTGGFGLGASARSASARVPG
jgi:SAM-dependent methyltransferase